MAEWPLVIQAVATIVAAVSLCDMFWQDLRHMLLPNRDNLALFISGAAFHIATGFHVLTWWEKLAGSIAGGVIFGLSGWLVWKLRGISAVGMGDVKFALAAGIWLGVEYLSHVLLLSCLGLMVGAVIYSVFKKKTVMTMRIPFGVAAAPITLGYILWIVYPFMVMHIR